MWVNLNQIKIDVLKCLYVFLSIELIPGPVLHSKLDTSSPSFKFVGLKNISFKFVGLKNMS